MSTSPPDDVRLAAELIEQLLVDASLRKRFRREPAVVCAEYGLVGVAADIAAGRHSLETLELRESRSSFAGALMAAAGEGAGVVDSMRHLHEHGSLTGDASRAVKHALQSPRLRSLLEHSGAAHGDGAPVQARGGSGIFPALGLEPRHPAGGPATLQLQLGLHDEAIASDPSAALADPADAYPGDDAARESIAAWMARQAHKAGLPGELPVMAGLVESDLHNDRFGDLDSLGYFQMRASLWEKLYPGFENHPELQLKWFIDHALAVRRDHVAAGDRYFGQNDAEWGRWIADVERPAEQYRGRYQLRLDEARALLHGAAAEAPVGQPSDAVDLAAGVAAPPTADAVVLFAERYHGTPYQWGGVDPETGFDCSGFVDFVYGHFGVHLPRVAADQFEVGRPVAEADLQPGDGVFFRDALGQIHHEGIYVGGGKFIHAPHTGDVVKISSLDEPYYAQQFAGGRRFADLAEPAVAPSGAPPGQAQPAGSGVFSALDPGQGAAPSAGGGNTVQFMPAVSGPGEPEPPPTEGASG